MRLRVGTRGSALARAQAAAVASALGDAEVVAVTTTGDRGQEAGDKARWVDGLERALLSGQIDLAVHSAKDVPSTLADGLALLGVPARADPRDVLIGAPSLNALAIGARIGTSSVRRHAQLLALRPDLELVVLHGNVDTRLRRLAEGACDALVLARAGLERLGRLDDVGGELDPQRMVPAPGQGALALEGRSGDEHASAAAAALTDPVAAACLRAERAVVSALGASCHTPVGALATAPDGARLQLSVWVGALDGSIWVSDTLVGAASAPERLGAQVADRVRAMGGAELLAEHRALAPAPSAGREP